MIGRFLYNSHPEPFVGSAQEPEAKVERLGEEALLLRHRLVLGQATALIVLSRGISPFCRGASPFRKQRVREGPHNLD